MQTRNIYTLLLVLVLFLVVVLGSEGVHAQDGGWVECKVSVDHRADCSAFYGDSTRYKILYSQTLEDILAVPGTAFYFRVDNKCLIPYTVAQQDKERFIPQPFNRHCGTNPVRVRRHRVKTAVKN